MEKQRGHDEETHGSGSAISGLTSADDDDTDEFGRMMLQQARDAHRLDHALAGRGPAFSKARPTPRVALTLHNLERNEAADHAVGDGAEDRRTGSVGSSAGSEPPLNIPRDWGRKARHSNGWLRRMNDADTRSQSQPEGRRRSQDQSLAHKTILASARTTQFDRVPTERQPLNAASQSNTPPSTQRQRHASTPPSLQQQRTSPKRSRGWDTEQDFTAVSLLESTPALPSRNRALDDIRLREIEGIEQRAVTTAQLSRIWENTPSEARLRRSSSKLIAFDAGPSKTAETRLVASSETRCFSRRKSQTSDKENVPFAAPAGDGTQKGAEVLAAVDLHLPSADLPSSQRPSSRRSDTVSLLKRLARATSTLPSPTSAKDMVEVERTQSGKDQARQDGGDDAPPLSAASANSNYIVHGSPSKSGQRQTSAKALKVVVGTGESTTQRATRDGSTLGTRHDQSARTPKATGAWLDSTFLGALDSAAPQDEMQPAQEHSSHACSPTHSRTQSEPSRPSSALAALLSDARANPLNNEALGDSTINSLEDLLNPTVDLDAGIATLDLHGLQAELDRLHAAGRPLTQADKDRRQELLAIEGMNKRLRAARTSIKDASRGLRRVERTVDAATEAADMRQQQQQAREHQKQEVCAACCGGRRQGSVFRAMWDEWWGLFCARDGKRAVGFRLTWLGLLCLVSAAYLLAESVMCEYYCHPRYAYKMSGYGIDPDAPRYPFVIPTLLFRPARWLWQPALHLLAWCFSALGSYISPLFSPFDAAVPPAAGGGVEKRGFDYYYHGGRGGQAAAERASGSSSSSFSSSSSSSFDGAARHVRWRSAAEGAAQGKAWGRGHLEKGNAWSQGAVAWEAGPEGLGADSMMDDEDA